ncbi:MAG: cytochrome C [Geobacteraceae bacterium GWC2_58_44]|nr:MAG: cytochrome C [Geobacteraceae bacterium GWC2_58_44]
MKMTLTSRGSWQRAALGALLSAVATLHPAPALPAEQPETVCIQCHAPLPGKLGAPVELWRKSIHAVNGISCNSCHGGDPKNAADAMNRMRGFLGVPKEQEIPVFCGRCHPGVLKDYLASAHGRALGSGGPTCVTCHGNHQIVKASLDLINEKSCTRCHSFERAKAIRDAMQQTEGSIIGIEQRISGFESIGVDTDRLGKALFAVRNRFHTLFHDVDVERVKAESTQINAELAKLDDDLRVIEQARAKRRVAGGIAVCFMLLVAVLLHRLKKSYD